jgi:uncharacterized protein (DUF697 family)
VISRTGRPILSASLTSGKSAVVFPVPLADLTLINPDVGKGTFLDNDG